MKFVVKKLGQDEFVRLYQEELKVVIDSREIPPLEIADTNAQDGPRHPWTLPPFANAKLSAFARTNVSPTVNVGRVFVTIKLPVGDLTSEQMRGLARLRRRFGDASGVSVEDDGKGRQRAE